MWKRMAAAVAIGVLAVGCASDKPHEYGQQRPPVGELDSRDTGLQSKDIVAASDQMAQDLLADPKLNASHTRWTIVVDHIDNLSSDRSFNMDIFLERLRVNLARYGQGRVQLIENKAKLHELQSRELESEREGAPPPQPRGIQPDYSLYGKVYDLPNRGTDYYMIEFSLTDLNTRQQVWTNAYEVKVAR